MRYMQGLKGFVFLLLFQCAGMLVAKVLHLPFPGSVLGMLLLLCCLGFKPVREPVKACADVLLSHLSLLFVPVTVGVMAQWPLLEAFGGRMVLVLVVSCIVGMLVTGWVLTWWLAEPSSSKPVQSEQAQEAK